MDIEQDIAMNGMQNYNEGDDAIGLIASCRFLRVFHNIVVNEFESVSVTII